MPEPSPSPRRHLPAAFGGLLVATIWGVPISIVTAGQTPPPTAWDWGWAAFTTTGLAAYGYLVVKRLGWRAIKDQLRGDLAAAAARLERRHQQHEQHGEPTP